MIGYYVKSATKNLGKYKFHTAVSLVSLTLGFLCFIAANVGADYLSSWDRHFPDSERIFTVNSSSPYPRNDGLPIAPRNLAPLLESEFPEIELAATEKPSAPYSVTIGDATTSLQVTFVEGDFLQIFPLELVSPSSRPSALPPRTALIMESAALRRFGTTDVVGRSLVIGQGLELTIGGVVRAMARPSHLQSILPGTRPDLIAPMRAFEQLRGVDAAQDDWNDRSYRIYVKLAAAADPASSSVRDRLVSFSERFVPMTYYSFGPHRTIFSFHPLRESGSSYFKVLFGSIAVTKVLLFAGFLVLFVGCLNYSNLVIAQLVHREHEIAVQKVVGAKRRQLTAQYSVESLLVAGIAYALAFAMSWIVLGTLAPLRADGFHVGLLFTPGLWLTSAAGLLAIVTIAGAYPALRVTKHSLLDMLRPAGAIGQSHRLRSLLVGTQFVFSGALLILAMFVFSQNRMMVSQGTNDALHSVLVLKGLLPKTADELDRLEAALGRSASIESTSRTKLVPWEHSEAAPLWSAPDPQTPFIGLNRVAVGLRYFETMGMLLLAGRSFSADVSSDLYPAPRDIRGASGPYSVVIDEATAARLGWGTPGAAVGQQVYTSYLPPIVDEPRFVALTIVGVVGNMSLEIAGTGVGFAPTHVFMLSPSESSNLLVRPHPNATAEALEHIDGVWSEFYPASRARPESLDDIFAQNYAMIGRLGHVFSALALFSFAISSIGLIGMATFIVRLRQREVGIRKVVGADKRRVLRMLLADFAKPVLIANLVAWPIGFALASAYLSVFSMRTPVTPLPFVLSLALSLGVAVLAVVYQARRSSAVRPAAVLKYE